MASPKLKVGARILVVGYNASGKSSLINKLAGNDKLAKVGDTISPTQHEKLVMKLEHDLQINGDTNSMEFIDSQGFGDPATSDRKIAENIAEKANKVDVVLICHKLYQRVDGKVAEELKELVRILGSKLMQHAIIVFTCGDEYLIHCKPKPVADLPNDEIIRLMKIQADAIKQKMSKILTSNGISQEIADSIPYCITSAEQDDLPTTSSGSWVDELWEMCKSICKPEAKEFVNWFIRNKDKVVMVVALALLVGGAATGLYYTGAAPTISLQLSEKALATLPIAKSTLDGVIQAKVVKAGAVGAVAAGITGGLGAAGLYLEKAKDAK